jgi:hypothetical protein
MPEHKQIEMTKAQLAADRDHLRAILSKLERTKDVIRRSQAAYLESRELLSRLQSIPVRPAQSS